MRPVITIRALAFAELGKLLAVDEPAPTAAKDAFPPSGAARLQLAYETLVNARNELLVAFGKQSGGGEVGAEVREMIVMGEAEVEQDHPALPVRPCLEGHPAGAWC